MDIPSVNKYCLAGGRQRPSRMVCLCHFMALYMYGHCILSKESIRMIFMNTLRESRSGSLGVSDLLLRMP